MNNNDRLDSWKEIAKYINRGLKTCHRWEKKLGFPVHRIDKNSSRSRVFAFKLEIDQWYKVKAIDENPEEISNIKE